jgi:hypothetical protein
MNRRRTTPIPPGAEHLFLSVQRCSRPRRGVSLYPRFNSLTWNGSSVSIASTGWVFWFHLK